MALSRDSAFCAAALSCLLCLLLTMVGCSNGQKPPQRSDASSQEIATPASGPDTSWLSPSSCEPCHAQGETLAAPWDAVAIYPDMYAFSPLAPAAESHRSAGVSLQLPGETTLAEWQAWQALLPAEHESKGQSCLSCHQRSDWQAPPELSARLPDGESPSKRLRRLHGWLHTAEDARDETFGLWVKAKTHRTLLIITVKVLNYGAGHRAPTGEGANVVLLVNALDGEGKPLTHHRGPRLPDEAGEGLAGRDGVLYARLYDGSDPSRAAGARRVVSDTRLQAGEHDELHFVYLLPEDVGGSNVPAWRVTGQLRWRDRLEGMGEIVEQASVKAPEK